MDLPGYSLLITACVALNILSFSVYAYDKLKAKTRTVRIPENLLLILAATGPFGAFAAMILFRHKTRHTRFLLVPVFLILHLLILFRLWFLPS